jgi:hypothetical protein
LLLESNAQLARKLDALGKSVTVMDADTNQEVMRSRSQSVMLNVRRGSNVKHPPLAFTEHGVIMAATVEDATSSVRKI